MIETFNIDDIIENNNLSIADKMNRLDEIQQEFIKYISLIKKEISGDFRFCPNCSQYYKKKFWEKKYDSFNTAEEKYIECPAGHKFIDFYDC